METNQSFRGRVPLGDTEAGGQQLLLPPQRILALGGRFVGYSLRIQGPANSSILHHSESFHQQDSESTNGHCTADSEDDVGTSSSK